MKIVKFPYLPSMISQRDCMMTWQPRRPPRILPKKTALRRLQGNDVQDVPNKKRLPDFLRKFTIMKTAICDLVNTMENEIVTRACNRFRSRLEKVLEVNGGCVEQMCSEQNRKPKTYIKKYRSCLFWCWQTVENMTMFVRIWLTHPVVWQQVSVQARLNLAWWDGGSVACIQNTNFPFVSKLLGGGTHNICLFGILHRWLRSGQICDHNASQWKTLTSPYRKITISIVMPGQHSTTWTRVFVVWKARRKVTTLETYKHQATWYPLTPNFSAA